MERTNLLTSYLTEYTPENRMGFMNLVLNKYRFEKYKLSVNDHDIKFEDLIVQDQTIRDNAQMIIDSGSCSKDQFKEVFNMLTVDQINYIGF